MIGSLKADNFLRNNIVSRPVNKSLQSDRENLSNGSSWEIKLNLLQLIVLWSVLAGAMVGVFLIGFYTGRDKGINFALENSNIETVRLPITNSRDTDSSLAATQIKLINQSEENIEKPQEQKIIDFKAPSENIIESKQGLTTQQIAQGEETEQSAIALKAEDKKTATIPAVTTEGNKNETLTKQTAALKSGWYSQLASVKSRKEADGIMSKMKAKKLSPVLEEVIVKGQLYCRILIGPYVSKAVAQKESIKAKQTKTFNGEPYIKQVK